MIGNNPNLKKSVPLEADEGGDWIATFGDMMSLLLCFFILLFSMSTLDAQKMEAAVQSLEKALKDKQSSKQISQAIKAKQKEKEEKEAKEESNPLTKETAIKTVEEMTVEAMEQIAEEMNMSIEDQSIQSQVKVIIDKRGVVIKIDAKVLYDPGKATIKYASLKMLDSIAALLNRNTFNVRVEGHTDNSPIASPLFPTNWELSTARATSVLRHFIANGVPPERLTAEGYAFYHPIESNETEAGKAANRRVEIVFRKDEIMEKLEEEMGIKETTPLLRVDRLSEQGSLPK